MLSNYHTHTTYDDGANTPEEMILAAVSMGLPALGFSGHSNTPFDQSYCMTAEKTKLYQAELEQLRDKYAGRLDVLIGTEQDYYSDALKYNYDFIIGSCHYMKTSEGFSPIDDNPQEQARCVEQCFGGDWYAYCSAYFENMCGILQKTGCDFIGHFDLPVKYNEGCRCFDEEDRRYYTPALDAVSSLCRQNAVFEINTGAVYNGRRSLPYPSRRLLSAIKEYGGRIIFSSDSHDTASLCYKFGEAVKLAEACGFKTCAAVGPDGIYEISL